MSEKEPTAYEQEMERLNNSVITIKNIDNEDFTHPYGGNPYTIQAGETLPFSFRVGENLAKHLAMRMARKEAKKSGKLTGNDDKKAVNLYAAPSLNKFLDKIIVSRSERPLPPRNTEADKERQRTEEIQREFRTEKGGKPTVDKRQIVAELKRRKVTFNPRDGIEELLELLKKSEMEGNQ